MTKRSILKSMAVAIFLVLIATTPTWADVTNGLVAHWTFDESSGNMAYDAVGGNDGTIYGAQRVEGLFDGAVSFDGNGDYISILENTLPQEKAKYRKSLEVNIKKQNGIYGMVILLQQPST